MTYKVDVSRRTEAFLKALSRNDKAKCRRLALLLLKLEKAPRPPGSWRLPGGQAGEDRAWDFAGFLIAYRLHEATRRVEVGFVKEA